MPNLKPNATAGSRFAVWLSGPNIAAAEIAAAIGYRTAVLDIEHGTFDLAALDAFIPLLKALGFTVIGKVAAPERAPIQQALDFGADAVAIPHVENVAHAAEVCAFAKFPPHGKRSFAGGRTARYGGIDDAWVKAQDAETRCYPMIEDASALADIEAILALPVVDGIFIGPTDLSFSCGRGSYKRTPADFSDLTRIAAAANAAGKHWLLPSWSDEEKRFALAHHAHCLVLTMEFGALAQGLRTAWDNTAKLVAEQPEGSG